MLPMGGLLIAIFSGWMMKQVSSRDEFSLGESSYQLWWFVIRFVSPMVVVAVFVNANFSLLKILYNFIISIIYEFIASIVGLF